jgi:hypothetical protein
MKEEKRRGYESKLLALIRAIHEKLWWIQSVRNMHGGSERAVHEEYLRAAVDLFRRRLKDAVPGFWTTEDLKLAEERLDANDTKYALERAKEHNQSDENPYINVLRHVKTNLKAADTRNNYDRQNSIFVAAQYLDAMTRFLDEGSHGDVVLMQAYNLISKSEDDSSIRDHLKAHREDIKHSQTVSLEQAKSDWGQVATNAERGAGDTASRIVLRSHPPPQHGRRSGVAPQEGASTNQETSMNQIPLIINNNNNQERVTVLHGRRKNV